VRVDVAQIAEPSGAIARVRERGLLLELEYLCMGGIDG
jgi:hypothetical protein